MVLSYHGSTLLYFEWWVACTFYIYPDRAAEVSSTVEEQSERIQTDLKSVLWSQPVVADFTRTLLD